MFSEDKPYFRIEDLASLNLPPIIVWAIPVMLSLVLLEYFLEQRKNRVTYKKNTFWPSVGIGAGNLVFTALSQVLVFTIILFCFNLTPLYFPITWWSFILCYIALDFCRYLAHRVAHRQRFWWATHVTHHSSEDYNFAVSFRLSWVQQLKLVFFLPIALAGFHPVVFFVCHQIGVLYQFWIHTETINKMPKWFEFIFVTPSHHRVHHGTNEQYIDKNFGSSLIIWDRIFGTFEPEVERATYGITKPMNSINPIRLVFHEFVDIGKDLLKVRNLKDAFKVVFSPPGTWENPDNKKGEDKKSPIEKVESVQ
ncbi:MAG: sterol desaturase/sphingolipid hydroxylase (fatty acid hydroxylase superfamily) [Arenicella sp.]|jgi:sterol desaturase/sphingolipid hydroxylase (fatty acid hydroxylase superfamily)